MTPDLQYHILNNPEFQEPIMTTTIKACDAKFGCWYELLGLRLYCVSNPGDGVYQGFVRQISPDGKFVMEYHASYDELTPLPDCTGWQWQPPQLPDPGPNHRLVDKCKDNYRDEQIDILDMDGIWRPRADCNKGTPFGLLKQDIYRIPLPPTYRPFANCDEYAPFRERWIRSKSEKEVLFRVLRYGPDLVGVQWSDWDYAWLFANYEFEDGTPCGVLVEP